MSTYRDQYNFFEFDPLPPVTTTQTYTLGEEYGLFEATPLCPLPPAAAPQMHAVHGNEYDSPVFGPPFTMTMPDMYAHRGEHNLLETDPPLLTTTFHMSTYRDECDLLEPTQLSPAGISHVGTNCGGYPPPPVAMPHLHTGQDKHNLLEAMATPKGAKGLRTRPGNAKARPLEDEILGRFGSPSDDPAMPALVDKPLYRYTSMQTAGNWYAQVGPESLAFQQDEWNNPELSHPMPRREAADSTGAHYRPRMSEAVDDITRPETDSGAPGLPTVGTLPEQCSVKLQAHRIDGTDNGESPNTSPFRRRRKLCNDRRSGLYACRIPGCKRFQVPLQYSRLRS
jgi:hypothetical protein